MATTDEAVPAPVPELVAGDRLTRAEFERRYRAMPRLQKAELIEGVVYVPSPARRGSHARPQAELVGWLYGYRVRTPGVEVCDSATVRLDLDNEPQPDALLRIREAAGGRSRETPDDYIDGPPELVAEVAASSASYDLHDKKRAYRRNGVPEYLVWRTQDAALDWFVLRAGRYARLPADADGVLRSEAFPGLWLDPGALLAGDAARVLAVLDRGLAAPEHAPFAARLRAALEG